jgi:hypothetical protein
VLCPAQLGRQFANIAGAAKLPVFAGTVILKSNEERVASSKKNNQAASSNGGDHSSNDPAEVTREELIAALNDDLAREYQAIIAYVIYSLAF